MRTLPVAVRSSMERRATAVSAEGVDRGDVGVDLPADEELLQLALVAQARGRARPP